MTNVFVDENTQQPSYSVGNLQPCTTYYWTVTATSQCGTSAPLAEFSFTTLDDLTFNATPTVSICSNGNAITELTIGKCFEPSGLFLAASGLPIGAVTDLPTGPVGGGGIVTIQFTTTNVAPGSYPITITGNDGVNNVTTTVTLNVGAPAAAPVFVAPANAATNVNVLTAFDWNPVAGATSYNFQLATDANFTNIVADVTIPQTAYTLTSPLNVNTTNYWRVTAFNNCGGTTPAPFSFTTWPVNAVNELNELGINVLPNPTSGVVNVQFSKPILENMDAMLFSINGILLENQQVQVGNNAVKFDLTELPSGVYLLQLKSGSGVLTKKIVLEK